MQPPIPPPQGQASGPITRCLARALRALAAAAPALAIAMAHAAAPVETGKWVHALSAYQPPKYPKGFTHFDYVNPDAPKGGVLKLRNPDRRSSFDKYNPFTTKGVAPAGVVIFMVESLAHMGQDEPLAMYGLLAEEMMKQIFGIHGIPKVVHADLGTSMTSKTVAALLGDLGVTRSHSRPHVSNDNPYSEAWFKTLKVRPALPGAIRLAWSVPAFSDASIRLPVR